MKLFKSIFSTPPSEASTGTAESSGTAGKSSPGAYVGESTSLPEGGRLHAKIEGRYVTILRLDGKLSCIDSVCFHAGGPLGIGDIEDVNGHKCLVCPWHFYKIDVQTGDKYYQALDFQNGKMVGGEWKSNGVRQRVHPVVEEGGKIYVTLSTKAEAGGGQPKVVACPGARPGSTCSPAGDNRVDSDAYAFDPSCGERILNAPPSALRDRTGSVGADGKKPSGQVLRGQYKS